MIAALEVPRVLRQTFENLLKAASPLTALADKKRSRFPRAASRSVSSAGNEWHMAYRGRKCNPSPSFGYFAAAASRVAMKLTTTAGASGADGSVRTTVPMNVSGCATPTFHVGIR